MKSLNSKWLLAISFFVLLVFALQPNTLNAQKDSKCSENVVGFVDGYVVFGCNKGSKGCENCKIKQDDCDCAAKKYKGAKGCVDACGKLYLIKGSNPEEGDDETINPSVHFLAGESNCRLQSEFATFIALPVKGDSKSVVLESKGKGNARWDFKAVEDGNHLKGFYILTREENPRALMVDGKNLSLRRVDQMDGKMHEQSQWNFYINGKDEDGNTNYYLHLQNGSDGMVLAADGSKNKLTLVDAKAGDLNTLSAGGEGSTNVRPEARAKNWNCECVF